MLKVLVAMTLLGSTFSALAGSSCPSIDATPESHKCMEDKIAEAEAVLKKYIDAAQREADEMNSSESLKLGDTQEIWFKYRESQCGDAYLFWLQGTYRYEATLNCQLEITRSRTHQVWSAFLIRFGSTPVLPEPQ